MKVTILITKDNDEQPAAFLKAAKDMWDSARNLKESQYPIECHVQIYGRTLRYDQNSDPTGKRYWAEDSGCSCPSPFEDIHSLSDLTEYEKTADEYERRKRLCAAGEYE